MSRGAILAIDQGTTNTKALLVGREGQPVLRSSQPVSVSSTRAGWVEQDACALWQSVRNATAECLAWAAAHDTRIEGVSISNQRETIIAWQRATGRPVAPAIVWQCRRSADICEGLHKAGKEAWLRARTGLGIDPLFSASKIQWLLENDPGLSAQADAGEICFGTVDSWLLWNLTAGAVHACDVSNASRTQLFNLRSADWDPELLALFGVPRCALPEIKTSSGILGTCRGVEGLDGIPIVSAMGDSHAAMAGHACFAPGAVKATYGTGSSLMLLLDSLPEKGTGSTLATTVAWRIGDQPVQYALEGNISMSGAAVQWVGEFLGLERSVEDAIALARTVEDCGGVYFVPAMVGLGAPHWDTAARGTVCGLGRSSRSAHLALAAVESIAFQIADVFGAMEHETGSDLSALHADGGATRNDWLMQFQADLLGRPVIRSAHEDLSALGAAWLGGLALGWWNSPAGASESAVPATTFEPGPLSAARAARYPEWQLAVRRARLKQEQP